MKSVWVTLLILLMTTSAHGSLRENILFRGYVRETPLFWQSFAGADRYEFTNLLHTRQNVRFYGGASFIAAIELKTRLFNGEAASAMASVGDASAIRDTYFRLDRIFVEEDRTFLISSFDRAWLDWTVGQVQITVGRQRIAWGTNLIWNPVDLFNPSSPLDFDNEEMPGTDAARVQWYLGPSELLELAYSPQRVADAGSGALQLKINRCEYDWIFIAGRRGSRTVLGTAWAGDIFYGGFRGEFLYSIPRGNLSDDAFVVISTSGDYTFRNTLYLHGGAIYNGRGSTGSAGGELLYTAYRRGDLTPARISTYAQVAGNPTALLNCSMLGILNPYDHSFYYGPSLTWSMFTDLDLTLSGLFFEGEDETEFGDSGNIIMTRLKYSF